MIPRAYYNEIDPQAAAWLRELIKRGLIPHGDVDERSIVEVQPKDIVGYTQCHFFAGIGGWGYALRLAGWFDDRPVWSGSCPCQPFSAAGKQKGTSDERHLWPQMLRLICECRPTTVFGEQVESAVRYGWLDGVCTDLEKEGYSIGAHVLGAHSVGAPHIRQRLYWVASSGMGNSEQSRLERLSRSEDRIKEPGWMEKAEIVEDTGEFIYSPDGGGQDGYHCNMEDFIDYLWNKFNCDEARTEEQIKEIEAQWPEFVFACEPSGLAQIGIDDIIERASDEMHDDFECDLEGLDIVERVLEDFYAKNERIVTWYSDEKKKICVPSFRDLKRENDIKRAELKKAVM